MKKPTWKDATLDGAIWEVKGFSTRSPEDALDAAMKPIFDIALGLPAELRPTRVERVQARDDLDREIEALFATFIRPLALFIGATGSLPESFGDPKAWDGEQLAERFPNLSIPEKIRTEGTFFVLDTIPNAHTMIVTVTMENGYYSTARGVERARLLERGLDLLREAG